jgi:hypothetical protein
VVQPERAPHDRGNRAGHGAGWHLVASIGGGDMPVVVFMLNPNISLVFGEGGLAQSPPP